MKIFAIIPSGGSGKRVNSSLPKQYLKFNGKELIAYTLEVFQNCELIDEIVTAAQPDFLGMIEEIREKFSFTKLTRIVEGGGERQDSVFNALQSLDASNDDLIIVHDAVRPLLPQDVLLKAIESAKECGSAIVAIRAKDTLIQGNDSVISYVNRSEYYYAQTPQIFKYKILLEAMKSAETEKFTGTDESMLVHRIGHHIKIVEGSSLNFKITNTDDIKLFQIITEHN